MKRMKIAGLCLVAVFAFSAMAVSSASAAEFGQCRELTKNTTPKVKHGQWTDANCVVHSEKKGNPASKGNHEWYPGPVENCIAMKKGHFADSACSVPDEKNGKGKGHFEKQACSPSCQTLTTSGGAAVLEGASGIKIECATNSSEGAEILSATEGAGVAAYTGCKIASVGSCASSGAAATEIKTYELKSNPIIIAGEVWLEYTRKAVGPNQPYLAEFECGGVVKIRVSGNADGLDAGNVNTDGTKSTQTFSKALGNQSLTTEKNTGSGFGGAEGSFQNQTTEFVAAAHSEIKT